MLIMQVTCCIYAGFEVVLFVAGMLVDLSVAIKQVTVSAGKMWLIIFIVITQTGVSVFKVVFSAVHYAQVYCNYAEVFLL